MSLSETMSPADFGTLMGNKDGFGGNGAWWIIILFLFAFCGGWGNNGWNNGNAGAMDSYVLASDFATLQRQLDSSTDRLAQQGNQIANGLCDGFYTQAQLVNGLQSQLASCCCETNRGIDGINYNMAMNSNALQREIGNGFCTTNFNNQSNTRDIVDNANANTRAILDAIQSNKVEALQDRIAEQNQQINALQLSASQSAQNQYLISQLRNPCAYNGCGC